MPHEKKVIRNTHKFLVMFYATTKLKYPFPVLVVSITIERQSYCETYFWEQLNGLTLITEILGTVSHKTVRESLSLSIFIYIYSPKLGHHQENVCLHYPADVLIVQNIYIVSLGGFKN